MSKPPFQRKGDDRKGKSYDSREDTGSSRYKPYRNKKDGNEFNSNSNAVITNNSNSKETYGFIISLKVGFGFIQPYQDEEHVYFPGRESYDDMKIGDIVAYVQKVGPKGTPIADNMRYLNNNNNAVIANKVRGIITRTPDRHRSNCGMIEIDFSSVPETKAKEMKAKNCKEVPFRTADVLSTTIPWKHRLVPGDGLEFTLTAIDDSSLYFPKDIRFTMTKRDRGLSVQVQRMLEAGEVREMGVVTMIKNREYGFIRSLDRSDEIYFRVEIRGADSAEEHTGNEQDNNEEIREGSEVSFFVVDENIRGKKSSRAIHLQSVPPGTVQFETLVASGVTATIIADSGNDPDETPGMARLTNAVNVENIPGKSKGSMITNVEIWQRCLPEGLTCVIGDVIKMDVLYYRPEKLFFARSVKIVKYRSIGREYGTIFSLKEHSFGFIRSQQRGCDLYFKSSQVHRWDGALIPESSLKVNATVTFDIELDSSSVRYSSNGSKFRATRVMLVDPTTASTMTNSNTRARYILKTAVRGIVVRNITKKDMPGLIKITDPEELAEIQDISFFEPELIQALEEFAALRELKSAQLYNLPLAVLKNYYKIIEDKFTNIAHEASVIDENDPSLGKVLKIYKINDPTQYTEWLANHSRLVTGSNGEGSLRTSSTDLINGNIQFYKDDYISPEFGPLSNSLIVEFEVVWDPIRCKKAASSVRLTDEPVPDCLDEQYGVVDIVVDKADRFGFIRCIPSDEKLFWHMSSTLLKNGAIKTDEEQDSLPPIAVGSEVAFEMRLRGGLRCATKIRTLPRDSLSKTEVLEEYATCLVIDEGHVVPIDVSNISLLAKKYIDLKLLNVTMSGTRTEESDNFMWEKLKIGAAPPTAPTATNANSSTITDSNATSVSQSSEDNAVSDNKINNQSENDILGRKYCPPIPRWVLPIITTKNNNNNNNNNNDSEGVTVSNGNNDQNDKFQVGDIVLCQMHVNWVAHRTPIGVKIMLKIKNDANIAIKRKGKINRSKLRVTNALIPQAIATEIGSEKISAYNFAGLEFVEIFSSLDDIKKTEKEMLNKLSEISSTLNTTNQYFYCDFREIINNDNIKRDVYPNGTEVEFWTIPAISGNVAINPIVIHKTEANFSGIQFNKRPTVNSAIKGGSTVTASVIFMAEGPEKDSAVGFVNGWREKAASATAERGIVYSSNDQSTSDGDFSVPKVLPWAFMLKHLPQYADSQEPDNGTEKTEGSTAEMLEDTRDSNTNDSVKDNTADADSNNNDV